MFMVLFIHLLAKYKLEDRRVEEPHADEVQPHVLEEGQVALGAGDRVLHSCHILKRGVVEENGQKKGQFSQMKGQKRGNSLFRRPLLTMTALHSTYVHREYITDVKYCPFESTP